MAKTERLGLLFAGYDVNRSCGLRAVCVVIEPQSLRSMDTAVSIIAATVCRQQPISTAAKIYTHTSCPRKWKNERIPIRAQLPTVGAFGVFVPEHAVFHFCRFVTGQDRVWHTRGEVIWQISGRITKCSPPAAGLCRCCNWLPFSGMNGPNINRQQCGTSRH